jgi:hypothetical protein
VIVCWLLQVWTQWLPMLVLLRPVLAGAVSLDTTVLGLRIQFSILEPTATSIYVDRIELVSL